MNLPRLVLASCCAAWLVPVQAQSAGVPTGASASASASVPARAPVVMRCPGPPVLYADNLSPQEVRSRNCKPVSDLPVAQAPSAAPRSATAAAPGGTGAASLGVPASAQAGTVADARVRADEQRLRDAEARRILEAELRREEGRLQDALKSAGTVRGERSAADAAHVRRVESDIEAIRRELARLR
ncbi:MAG: hypothetical protein ACKOB5_12440 [Betaproteobacteria bacterium]